MPSVTSSWRAVSDGDLAVGGAQLGAGGLERRLEPCPLGGPPAAAPLLEVDGIAAAAGQHGERRARCRVARAASSAEPSPRATTSATSTEPKPE